MLQKITKQTQTNQGQLADQLGSIFGVIVPFGDLWTAPKPNSSHSGADFTFPDLPCQLGQIFMVPNGLYRCPTHSTTYFMFNSHLLGAFQALQSQFQRYSGEVVFAATAVQILKILLLGHFLQMFCMKRVLCINISRPEAKFYEYITYWLISSRIANC